MSTENTTSKTENTDPSGGDGMEFHCPYCEISYSHEILTRVHITRADDKAHQTHDGLMPETAVKQVSANGDSIRITRAPEEIDVNTLELVDLPDQLSSKKKQIILTAVSSPYVDTYTELHERVQGVFHERELGSVSYDKVRRTVQEFFLPADDNESTPAKQRYANLTDKQQRVIDAYIANPSATYAEIAEQAETSQSYPTQILNKFEMLVTELQNDREKPNPTDDTPDSESAPSGLEAENNPPNGSSIEEELPSQTTSVSQDGPITSSVTRVMSASPYEEPASPSAESATRNASKPVENDETSDQTSISEAESNSDEPVPDETESSISETKLSDVDNQTLLDQVAQVKERVSFLRRIAERQIAAYDSAPSAAIQLAVSEEIESELDQILAGQDGKA